MRQGCTCDRVRKGELFDPARDCGPCWLWHHDREHRRIRGGDPADVVPVRRKTAADWLAPKPCRHRGEATGEVRTCTTCTGRVPVPLLACAVHGTCYTGNYMPDGHPLPKACDSCREREAPAAAAPAAVVIEHGAGGLGDGLLGLCAVARLKADNPGARVVFRAGGPALPFLRLFHGYDEVGLSERTHTEDPVPGARQMNAGYRAEQLGRYPVARWLRYAKNIGATGVLTPGLREPDRLRSLGADLAGAVCLFPFSTDKARTWALHEWLTLEEKLHAAGFRVAVFGLQHHPVDRFKGEKLVVQPPERVTGVILNAAACVGSDSGLSHLAGLLGVPTVVLGGSTPVEKIFGLYPKVSCLQGGLSCSGCGGGTGVGGAVGATEACLSACANLNSITPGRVLSEVRRVTGAGRLAALPMLKAFREFTPADAAEQLRHVDEDVWLYQPGRWRYLCSLLGAVHEEIKADRPDLAGLLLEAVWMGRRLHDFGTSQNDLDWASPPRHVPGAPPLPAGGVLFLDDRPDRWERFRGHYPGATWVRTTAEAMTALRSRVWDAVFLDHDLHNEPNWAPPRPALDNGTAVVTGMIREQLWPRARLVIHSTNEPCAAYMNHLLHLAGRPAEWLPFDRDGWVPQQGTSR